MISFIYKKTVTFGCFFVHSYHVSNRREDFSMTQYLVVLLVSLLISAIGFGYYIHFFSVGYGFSIAGIGLTLLLLFIMKLNPVTLCMLLLLIFYGARLGGFLLYRERKNSTYNRHVADDIKDDSDVSFFAKYMMWISCALLYTLMTCPILFRLLCAEDPKKIDISSSIGLFLMLCGILLELISDLQKNEYKKKNPSHFVEGGLYRFVRCPNYLGEILLWSGVLISGIGAVPGFLWIPAITGYIGILYVMFSGARRLELRQNRTYGTDPAYQAYVLKVPILIPFVPLYSLEKYTFLKA